METLSTKRKCEENIQILIFAYILIPSKSKFKKYFVFWMKFNFEYNKIFWTELYVLVHLDYVVISASKCASTKLHLTGTSQTVYLAITPFKGFENTGDKWPKSGLIFNLDWQMYSAIKRKCQSRKHLYGTFMITTRALVCNIFSPSLGHFWITIHLIAE